MPLHGSRQDIRLCAHPDTDLTTEQLERLHARLLQERDRITGGIQRHMLEATQKPDVRGDEADEAIHAAEQATLFQLADRERDLLQAITAALHRMQSGEYGLCEGTGEPIAIRRLEARPWARYSVGYKEAIERARKAHLRRH